MMSHANADRDERVHTVDERERKKKEWKRRSPRRIKTKAEG
jgi:hypothetical protein